MSPSFQTNFTKNFLNFLHTSNIVVTLKSSELDTVKYISRYLDWTFQRLSVHSVSMETELRTHQYFVLVTEMLSTSYFKLN